MNSNDPSSEIRDRISALGLEIARAQEAAVNLDVATLEDAVREHLRLTEELKVILEDHPRAEEWMRPLRPALRRYALLLRGSERLVNTISRVLDRGGISPACGV